MPAEFKTLEKVELLVPPEIVVLSSRASYVL